MKTFCPECGFGVKVDVDGCCLYCGSVATGSAVDELSIPERRTKMKRNRTCFDCNHLEMRADCDVCLLEDRMLETKKIPEWCPLKDAPNQNDNDICQNCGEPLMCGQDGLPFCFGCGSKGTPDSGGTI
jgi:hypothetical protein